MKKLLITCFLLGSFAYGQTASNTITLNGTNYLVVEGRVDVGCIGELAPVPLAIWEHAVIGAGFTSSGTNRLYSRVRGNQTITVDQYLGRDRFEVVISNPYEQLEDQTFAQVIELIY